MKKLKEAHLLVNPVAGNGQSIISYKKLKRILLKRGIPFTVAVSKHPKQLIDLAKDFANQDTDQSLIVIGGDGSLNEVLNGVKNSMHPELPIAYLPAGSGNDFARAADLSKEPEQLIDSLSQKLEVKKVDCGSFIDNQHPSPYYFVNNFGIGFDAFVVHESNNQELKAKLNKLHLGNFIYGFNILNVLRKQDTFRVEVTNNGKTYHFDQVYFTTTTNHPYFGGGIAILPKANIYSHKLDTVVVQKPNLAKFIRLFGKLLKDGSHIYDPHFHYIEGTEIQVKTINKEFAQIDGEDQAPNEYQVNFKIDSFNLLK